MARIICSGSRASRGRRWYEQRDIQIVLLVDPDDHAVDDLRADGQHRVLRNYGLSDMSAIIPNFRLSRSQLFATLRL